MSDFIFHSLGQCLWISYAIEAIKPSPKTWLRVAIEAANTGEYAEKEDLNRVQWNGASDEDKIGQAVYVRKQVKKLLSPVEHDHVLARYSMVKDEETGLMKEKMDAVNRLAKTMSWHILDGRDEQLMREVIWSILGPPVEMKKFTSRKISSRNRVARQSVDRIVRESKSYIAAAWSIIEPRLEDHFTGIGLVG